MLKFGQSQLAKSASVKDFFRRNPVQSQQRNLLFDDFSASFAQQERPFRMVIQKTVGYAFAIQIFGQKVFFSFQNEFQRLITVAVTAAGCNFSP